MDAVEVIARANHAHEWARANVKPPFEADATYWLECARMLIAALEREGYEIKKPLPT